MIYGIIPIGGKGTRLGLPFPKELLPQKGFNFYNPVVNHTVSKMLEAGAKEIIFVHGLEYKKEVKEYYPQFKHIIQYELGFSKVLAEAYHSIGALESSPEDQFLFGLPDSVYDGNPFIKMVKLDGMVCGLFKTDPRAKVDRLSKDSSQVFEVKSPKTDSNQEFFWGVLKFDTESLIEASLASMRIPEIGTILNKFNKRYVFAEQYIDLGTWDSFNRY